KAGIILFLSLQGRISQPVYTHSDTCKRHDNIVGRAIRAKLKAKRVEHGLLFWDVDSWLLASVSVRKASQMSGSIVHLRPSERRARASICWALTSALLVGCRPDSEATAPQVRPIRTVTVEKHEAGSPVTLTGRIEAKDEVTLGFRISGRLLENKTK